MPVAALTTQTATDTSALSNENPAALNVRLLISSYFSERTAFLQQTNSDIPSAITPIVNDEVKHLAALTTHQAVLLNASFTIHSIAMWDKIAEVSVTETVTYLINGTETQSTIPHEIVVYLLSADGITISSDAYYDATVEFYSCSYIRESDASPNNAGDGGSKMCIIKVANNEWLAGEGENSNGVTKYGTWYGWPAANWCAMFVAWCAEQANISTSVIPKTAYVPTMRDHYASLGRFYLSASQGGSYTPQPGDLFFQYDTPSSPGHVGIVASVTSDKIYVYDGNNTPDVTYRDISLSCSSLVGYARVTYATTSHTYSWTYDVTRHWRECENCNYAISSALHTFQAQGSVYVCTVCGYQTTILPEQSNLLNE